MAKNQLTPLHPSTSIFISRCNSEVEWQSVDDKDIPGAISNPAFPLASIIKIGPSVSPTDQGFIFS